MQVDYLDKGHTITRAYCDDLLIQQRENIKQILRGKLTRGVLFYQDNAPTATSTATIAAITKCGFQLVERTPYSPDFGPCDYYFFPKIKKEVPGHHFARDDDAMNAVDHFLRDLNSVFYTEGIRLLHKCVYVGGGYVKK